MAINLINIANGNGSNGFVIYEVDVSDNSGRTVSSAGDVNGDGFDDVIIGSFTAEGPGAPSYSGESYVVFGAASGFAAEIDLVDVSAGVGGFVIRGIDLNDRSGKSVSSAGDINADGFDDIIVGAPDADGPGETRNLAGESYIIFGSSAAVPGGVVDLAAVSAGTGAGFVIYGEVLGSDQTGFAVSNAGDVNGDGFADIIIGATHADGPGNTRSQAGGSYVVFGKDGGFGASVDLANVAAGNGGFVVHGVQQDDFAGYSVSTAGDVNGDGFDDLLIGARYGDGPANGRSQAGESYVVFGHAGGFPAAIDLVSVSAGNGGFVIQGADTQDWSGWSVSDAGDINRDGFDDILIGAYRADSPGTTPPEGARDRAGDTYVIFGSNAAFPAAIDLVNVAAGTGGFVIHGANVNDQAGFSVSSAGDVNGDGFDDILIGAHLADGPGAAPGARGYAGDVYVVFGKASGFAAAIDLVNVANGNGGFAIYGRDGFDNAGGAVSSAGDVNGDGFDDILIGAPRGDGDGPAPGDRSESGESYVIFGKGNVGGSNSHVTHQGTALNNLLTGNANANVMIGGRGDDILLGNGGADVLRGGQGNDTLTVASAAFARIVGGTGSDVLAFSGAITLADADFRRVSEVESIKLANGATNLTLGAIAAHAIVGLAGNSFRITVDASSVTNAAVTIDGGALIRPLTVNLSGDAQAVTLRGGFGADSFTGGLGADTLDGRGGADTLVGLGGNDFFFVDNAADAITEGAGEGTGDRVLASVTYTLGAGDQVEIMSTTNNGGTGAINLTGNEFANTIFGNAGANALNGGIGADSLVGFGGNDSFFVDNAADAITEGAGEGAGDRVLASVSYTLGAGDQIEIMSTTSNGGTGAINLTGNEFANTIFGNAGANTLDGRAGADTLAGLGGNDFFFVDNAADAITEGSGEGTGDRVLASVSYTLGVGDQVEIMSTTNHAGAGAINLTGNEFVNAIYGNAGSNVLNGKAGADTLVGFGGADFFLFDTALNAATNVDAISGFSVADDTIRLENAIFTAAGTPGTLAAAAFRVGASAADASDRILYNSATGAVLYDADGLGGAAAVQFATVGAGLGLTNADFIIV